MKSYDFKELLEQKLKDPEFRKEWECKISPIRHPKTVLPGTLQLVKTTVFSK